MRNYGSLVFLTPVFAHAAEPAVSATGNLSGSSLTGQLGSLLLGLLLVLGLIFLLAWLARRVQRMGPGSNQAIKLVASQALGTRDRLLLVQVGEEQILLGISAGRITPLHVLKEPVVTETTTQATPEFAQRLMELLGKDKEKR